MNAADLPDTHDTWFDNFESMSGLEPLEDDTIPFQKVALANLLRYKELIEENRDNYLELQRSLQVIVDNEQTQSHPLTIGQKKALDDITAWMSTPEPYFVLRGYAGTGKSYIVSLIANRLAPMSALFTAPTNKATKVLKTLMPQHPCRTIYSALSLKMAAREDELVLTPSEHKFNLRGFTYVFVDEASMLNTEVIEYIDEAVKAYGLKVILIGDFAQLPPVGEDISSAAEFTCSTAELTEVVRHKSQILTLATHVRHAIVNNKRLKPIDLNDFDGPRTVWQLSPHGFRERLHKMAKKGFEDSRAIAWRNRTVDNLNEIVRGELYGHRACHWEVDDRIVVTEPIGEGVNTLATIDDEGIIMSVDVGEDQGTNLSCYFINVKMETGTTIKMRIIHESSADDFSALLGRMASDARKPGQQKKWREFWAVKTRFNSIRHSYAITSHRSQGSSIPTVFVDAADILSNSDRDTAYRCLYVAISRASGRLYITGLPT